MLKCLLILVLVAAAVYSSPVTKPAWKKPDFCQSFECPRFKLIRDAGAYQVRRYEEAWWVGANATSGGLFSNAGLFFKLFRYMFGNNERGANMGMTVPVAMKVSFGTSNRTMSFYIPSAHQNNPPKPVDPSVVLEKRPAFTVFVRAFSGYAAQKEYRGAFDALVAAIDDNTAYHTHHMYGTGYDQPAKFWGRHNEVWLLKK